MSRPSSVSVNRTVTGWVATLNSLFSKWTDGPAPFYVSASTVDLAADFPPVLYSGCFAIVGDDLYQSDGTSWLEFKRQPLTNKSALDPGTAVLLDVVVVFNQIVADMRTKGWMIP